MSLYTQKKPKYNGIITLGLLVTVAACSNNAEETLVQTEADRKKAIAEISTVNQTLNSGASNIPLTNKPITSNVTKFSSDAYGVAGSPRITTNARVRKGGGRYQVGKPYTIRGKTYYPKEDPNYKKVGSASWYGPNFHGRLTANGEVYDQFGLSAAHPTMPLPSYARVTNLENGSSVTVRVNDRGPFAHNRIIDLSARAAQLLGYEHKGVAKVRVQYVGKARMDGLDEEYLVASYDPGNLSPNLVPAQPNGQPVQVANAQNRARQSLAAFTEGLAAPVPQVRPLTSSGVPLNISDNNAPRPALAVNSYVASANARDQHKAIQALDQFHNRIEQATNTDFAMQDIVHLKFGPFNSEERAKDSGKLFEKQGYTDVYSENGLSYLHVTSLKNNLSNIYQLALENQIPVKK